MSYLKASFKIVLFGDGMVGKTTLRHKYMGKGFKTEGISTIGADFASIKINIKGKNHIIQIWDLAGQPGQQTVRKMFYRGAQGGLAVFDITRRETFDNLPNWFTECFQHNGRGKIPIVILGNKVDLRGPTTKYVQTEEGHAYAETLKEYLSIPVYYFDTSAKTGLNVKEAFDFLGKNILIEKKVD